MVHLWAYHTRYISYVIIMVSFLKVPLLPMVLLATIRHSKSAQIVGWNTADNVNTEPAPRVEGEVYNSFVFDV